MDVKVIAALVLCGLAVILDIVGLAIPYWLSNDALHMGLFKFCGKTVTGDFICLDNPEEVLTSRFQAVRAMVILGLLLAVGAAVCYALRQFMMKDKPILDKIAGGLAIAGGLFMIIGAIIFATDDITTSDLNAGFALVIVAAIFAFAAAACMFLTPSDE